MTNLSNRLSPIILAVCMLLNPIHLSAQKGTTLKKGTEHSKILLNAGQNTVQIVRRP